MKVLSDDFKNVTRTALVIKPKQPFQDWLQKIDPDDQIPDELLNDNEVYLLPDFEEIDEMENWLIKNFDEIFTDQLNHWYMDESLWVQNRNFDLFKKWFDYSLHTMVWDTLKTPIQKI